jgi:hypothetical protein
LKKLDSILKQNKEIEDFKVFDVDSEWNLFLEKVGKSQPLMEDKSTNVKKSPLSVIFRKPIIYVITIAASFILILGFLFMFKNNDPYRTTVITTNNIEKINMIDGSKIELSQNSKLEYPLHLDDVIDRKIILAGSATFSVKKNDKLPFRVFYGDVLVEVLGTEFVINKKDGMTIIQNISGKIAVSQVLNRNNKRILEKGETLLFKFGNFFVPQDTIKTVVEESKNTNLEPLQKGTPKTKSQKEKPSTPEVKGSTFKLDNVIKGFLLKFHKKKIKVERGTKFDKNTNVKIDINKTYQEILLDLKTQGHIDFKPGDCDDCFIITSPAKKQ